MEWDKITNSWEVMTHRLGHKTIEASALIVSTQNRHGSPQENNRNISGKTPIQSVADTLKSPQNH